MDILDIQLIKTCKAIEVFKATQCIKSVYMVSFLYSKHSECFMVSISGLATGHFNKQPRGA